jgi:hypothetical protein
MQNGAGGPPAESMKHLGKCGGIQTLFLAVTPPRIRR